MHGPAKLWQNGLPGQNAPQLLDGIAKSWQNAQGSAKRFDDKQNAEQNAAAKRGLEV